VIGVRRTPRGASPPSSARPGAAAAAAGIPRARAGGAARGAGV